MGFPKIGLEALFKTDEFTRGLDKYTKGLKKGETETGGFGKTVTNLVSSMGPLAIGVGVVAGAVTGAAMAFKKLQEFAQPAVDYAKQVRDLGRAIGENAEESSKLIQVADDVNVSYQTLMQGLIAGVRKGIDPSTESLGKLSDEYRQLQPGLERTKFLTDNFGRAGAELAPLMELGSDAIARMGEEAEKTGLVLDEKAVQAARNYEIAVDSLDDTITGLKTTLGIGLLPALISVLDTMNDFIILQMTMNKAVESGAKSRLSMNYEMAKITLTGKTMDEVIEELNKDIEEQESKVESTKKEWRGYGVVVEYTEEATGQLRKGMSEVDWKGYNQAMRAVRKSAEELNNETETQITTITAAAKAELEMKNATDALKKAQDLGIITELEMTIQLALLKEGLIGTDEALIVNGVNVVELTEKQMALIEQEKLLEEQTKLAAEKQERLAAAIRAAEEAARAATIAYYDLVEQLSKDVDVTDLAIIAMDHLQKMFDDNLISEEQFRAGIEQLGFKYGVFTQQGVANTDMMSAWDKAVRLGIVDSDNYAEAFDAVVKAAQDGSSSFEEVVQVLIDTGTATTMSQDALDAFEGRMAILDLNPAIEGTGALAGNLSIIAGAPTDKSFNYTITTEYITHGTPPPTAINYGNNLVMAEGGAARSGNPYIVGDAGRPEVFVPQSNGFIFPSISSFRSAMQGAGGNTTRNYNLNIGNVNGGMQTVQRSFAMARVMEGR